MASTKEVVDRHLEFFGKGDLKGILSDYAPGAVFSSRRTDRLGELTR